MVPIQHGTPEHAMLKNPVPPHYLPISGNLFVWDLFFKVIIMPVMVEMVSHSLF